MSRKKPNGSAGLTDEANPTPANDGQSPVISEIFRNSTYLNWCRILSQVYRKKLSHADWKWPQPLLSKLSSALSRLEEGKQLRAKKKKGPAEAPLAADILLFLFQGMGYRNGPKKQSKAIFQSVFAH